MSKADELLRQIQHELRLGGGTLSLGLVNLLDDYLNEKPPPPNDRLEYRRSLGLPEGLPAFPPHAAAEPRGLANQLAYALKAAQFDCRGKCPVCAGFNVGPNGETARVHNKTCVVGKALAAYGDALKSAGKE